jgi:hypothetical protein
VGAGVLPTPRPHQDVLMPAEQAFSKNTLDQKDIKFWIFKKFWNIRIYSEIFPG